ncbi:uncharacterized protein BJ212DRAFT_920031 [Suillus subaureus]|uniref:Uncharacterized protein n=1 Tax=Suillus subaureus TaxID=48587 RepID=A0A9P7EHU7_9AGAM|nr:uncharacterized protein BJ212DRAFT_920031 [Suillus subaureus]KAG1821774.1 hypothetical protein BJ212DRAFT_920031 [Suillus subaureus]
MKRRKCRKCRWNILKDISKHLTRIVPVLLLHILATRASRIEKSSASLLGRPTCNPRYLCTRLDITANLLSLPPLQLLPLTGLAADIDYDIMWLGSPVGMFAICGGIHHGHASKRPVTHSFLLRQKEACEEDARADGVWPLVAVAHQMMVFDGP